MTVLKRKTVNPFIIFRNSVNKFSILQLCLSMKLNKDTRRRLHTNYHLIRKICIFTVNVLCLQTENSNFSSIKRLYVKILVAKVDIEKCMTKMCDKNIKLKNQSTR